MAQNKKSKKKMPKEQQTSFKELSFSDKIRYIFGYYKYYMLAAVIIIAAAGYTIYSFVQNNYDIKCNIVVVDGKITGYPAIDYVVRLDTPLEVGEVNRARGEDCVLGGKGIPL